MTVGIVVLVACLLVACALELLRRRYDGRFRQPATTATSAGAPTAAAAATSMASKADRNGTPAPDGTAAPDGTPAVPSRTSERADPGLRLTAADLAGADLGERATLVQFSSAFCAPCRAARQLLRDVAAKEPGVAYAEIDAESHLDLVRRLHILRTPTVLVLDHVGRIATRASGLPRRPDVVAALRSVCQFGVR